MTPVFLPSFYRRALSQSKGTMTVTLSMSKGPFFSEARIEICPYHFPVTGTAP